MPKSRASAQPTTAAWVDLAGSLLDVRSSGIFSFLLKCTVQKSKYRVLAANDDNFNIYVIDEPETLIAKDAMVGVGGPAFYLFYKVQIIEDTAGGSIESWGASK